MASLPELLSSRMVVLLNQVNDLSLTKRARELGGTPRLNRNGCLQALCEHHGIAFDPEASTRKKISTSRSSPSSSASRSSLASYTPELVTPVTVKRIWHISDPRINEWTPTLSNTITAIREDGIHPDDLIIITGDIFHTQTFASYDVFDRFIRELSNLFSSTEPLQVRNRILIISETPNMEKLTNRFFRHVRPNQVLQYGKTIISTVHRNEINEPASEDWFRYVAVAHRDLINNSGSHSSTEWFRGHDALLLGGINQEQQISAIDPVAYYAGSLTQTSDSADDHGILLWNLAHEEQIFVTSPEFIEIST